MLVAFCYMKDDTWYNTGGYLTILCVCVQPVPPVMSRASTVKSEIADSENMRYKLENKEEDLRDLKKQLRMKVSWFMDYFPVPCYTCRRCTCLIDFNI